MRGAPDVREAVRVERMHVQHRHALVARFGKPLTIVQRMHLHATATVTLHAVAGAGDDQQSAGIHRAITRHIHRHHLAVFAFERVDVGLDLQTRRSGGFQKFDAGLRVAA